MIAELAGMIARAVLRLVDDMTGMQSVSISVRTDEALDGIERMQPYGLSSVPLAGAEALVVHPGGAADHALVIACDDRRYRPTGSAPGEVILYNHLGHRMRLHAGGVAVTGPTTITGSLATTGAVSGPSATFAGIVAGGTIAAGAGGLSVGGTGIPLPGATGTFTTADVPPRVVTVMSGIITGIV
jgi:phage baseplate assembly protein V